MVRQLHTGYVAAALTGVPGGNDKPAKGRGGCFHDVVENILRPGAVILGVLFILQFPHTVGEVVLIILLL